MNYVAAYLIFGTLLTVYDVLEWHPDRWKAMKSWQCYVCVSLCVLVIPAVVIVALVARFADFITGKG